MSGSSASSSSARTAGASPCRANWLRSRPRANRASSRFWRTWASQRSRGGIRSRRSQNRPEVGGDVEVVEVRPERREQLDDRQADPGRCVDAVGQAEDRLRDEVLPRAVGGLAVELAHGVGAVGQPEREGGHVELAGITVHAEPQLQDLVDRHAATVEDRPRQAPDEVRVEALVPGRHRAYGS